MKPQTYRNAAEKILASMKRGRLKRADKLLAYATRLRKGPSEADK